MECGQPVERWGQQCARHDPTPPYPPYDVAELREDLHHLIQPFIGLLRLEERDNPDPARARQIDRLRLALALTDIAAGAAPREDYDARMGRTRHGCGYFRNEPIEVRQAVQAAVDNANERTNKVTQQDLG